MAMVKIIDPSGWDFDRPVAQMVKVSSRGLRGQDRKDFIKVASSAFLHLIDNIKLAEGEIPIHLISHGSSEAYGPNRNGDGFKEACCKKYAHTFEKYARWYRNHKNKDPSKSYGRVKQAAYNDSMRRVELLSILNGSEKVAKEQGGFVADREMARLANGEDIPVSMACRVPYDVCSGCGNQARTRDDYCTEKTCDYGGCKNNLTKVAEDGHILHVDNPHPTWFDISDVFRPADRIAYGGQADYLQKAASHQFMPGAELADALGVVAPLNVILANESVDSVDARYQAQVKLAHAMAQAERIPNYSGVIGMAFHPQVLTPLTQDQLGVLGQPGTEKAAQALGALADHKVVLSLKDFARWIGKEAEAEQAEHLLPQAYNELVNAGDVDRQLAACPYVPSEKVASVPQRTLAKGLENSHSLDPAAMRERMMRASIRGLDTAVKVAADKRMTGATTPEARQLSRTYALYKLAALHRVASSDPDFNLTVRFALAQNGV